MVKLDVLGDTSVSCWGFFFKWWKERHLRAADALPPTLATHRLACANWTSAKGGKPCGGCQNLLAILGRADVWATASPSLSLKIQLSFGLKFHLHLLSQVVVNIPQGADTKGQEQPREADMFRARFHL